MGVDLLNRLAEELHNCWVKEKKKLGHHHPSKCPDNRVGCLFKCHENLKPYLELPENVRDFNKQIIADFIPIFTRLIKEDKSR
ncbi:MAG: hypothetical protein HQ538_00675 [Parcubacteria group bacterium]|nr:hypothetical protein [Parcubacteria group bacterium]